MQSRLWGLAVSAALPLAVPAVAGAATIRVEPDHVRFVDDDAAQRLLVEQSGGQVRFRYASPDATPISAPPPCSQTEPAGSAACPVRDCFPCNAAAKARVPLCATSRTTAIKTSRYTVPPRQS
jgi:hypothetical protein